MVDDTDTAGEGITFVAGTGASKGIIEDHGGAYSVVEDWVLVIAVASTAWNVSKYGVFSGPYFPTFGREKAAYLNTSHSVPPLTRQKVPQAHQGLDSNNQLLV